MSNPSLKYFKLAPRPSLVRLRPTQALKSKASAPMHIEVDITAFQNINGYPRLLHNKSRSVITKVWITTSISQTVHAAAISLKQLTNRNILPTHLSRTDTRGCVILQNCDFTWNDIKLDFKKILLNMTIGCQRHCARYVGLVTFSGEVKKRLDA